MSENLENTLPHSETLTRNNTSSADGVACDLRVNYEYDDGSEKPILLELGATSNTSSRNTTDHLSILPYTNNYPLEFHLNGAFSSVLPTLSHAYNIDPALFFNNPYNTNRITTTTSQGAQATSSHSSSSSSLISRNTMPYSGHIPQTVYGWSPPTITPSTTLTDVNGKLTTEVVPPAVYMTYSDSREHAITKRSNYSRKEKPLQSERDNKRTACDRERTRMRDMNKAFDLLRSKLPITKPNGKKYSKIESLRIAINYIKHLQKILEDNTTDQMNLATAKYLNELNIRRRPNLYHSESHKSRSFEDANERFENLDESRSTWSDSYMPNSQD